MAYLLTAIGPDPDKAGFDGPSSKKIYKYPHIEKQGAGASSYLRLHGYRFPEQLVPKKYVMISGSGPLLDVIDLGERIGVNDLVRAIMERIAPGQVEFIPFEYELLDGAIKQYSFMNVLRHVACVCWNMGNVFDQGRAPSGMRNVGLPQWGSPLDITVKRDAHGGLHIWHEDDAGKISSWIFISDELAQVLEESRATGLRLIPVKEI